MTSTEKMLGIGSFFTLLGVIAMAFGSQVITEIFGFGILAIPIVGGVTAFWSLFYVYRNNHIGLNGFLWIISMSLFWFIILPVFWYQKIYMGQSKRNLTTGYT